uniref:HP domain-containing protein n=1 Tax=Paramoeba aestuarina TaxID=180227 RepID=A0A7S4UJ59_9EUKA|mmetsp:Transcript_3608/g.5439  ORF Transcript_3608/g.5439 Transcript_3608/m.5439 type:complete len:761 (+) Transcript_3608:575-2857(+)
MANQGGMTPRITPRQSQERIDRQTAAKREMLQRAVSLRQKGPMQKITVEPGKEGEENAKPSLGAEAKAKAKQHEKVGQGRPHRLYCCKGKRRIRVVLVDTVPEVLNQGDVYILDCIKTLYVWHGNKHSPLKKAKGVEITARLKSGDRKGAKVVNLFSRDGQDDDPEFWKQLGADSSARENIPPADITKDLLFEKEIDERTTLYRLLESDELLGKNERGYELDRVGAPGEKLIQKMLDTNFCYVLDCPEGEGFAWVGKKSPNPARVAVMQHLRLMFSSRPEWCYVSRNVEGGESLFFKEKFASWADNTPMGGGKRLVPFGKKREDKAKKPAKTDVLKLHSNIPHEEEMVDEGQGEVERWRMVDKALQEEPQDSYLNHFWSDESYNVLYTWKKGNALRYIIYYWQGRTCHIQDKGLAALMINEVVKVVKSRSGEPVQKRQVQMDETIHFHYIFKKRFVVHQGKQHGPTDDFPPALYHVSGFNNLPGTIKAVEVDCKVSRLSPQGVFILHTPKEQWVWEGSGSRRSIRDAALDFCKEISKIKKTKHQGEPLVVKQGKELQSFWDVIPGGRSYFASAKHLNRPLKVRMFKASSGTGTFVVDEMYPFSQAKLDPENVFIVDGVHEVYIWCGPWSNAADATKAMAVAVEYVEKASDGRLQSTPVRRLEGGRETADFAALFHAWKGETIDSEEEGSGDNVLEILKELNRTYTYKELLNNPPKGLEKTRLESYLSDEEFEQIFDRTKEEFYALPEWIRTKRRQDVGLY